MMIRATLFVGKCSAEHGRRGEDEQQELLEGLSGFILLALFVFHGMIKSTIVVGAKIKEKKLSFKQKFQHGLNNVVNQTNS